MKTSPKYALVPENDHADIYAAGADGNTFATIKEAEAAIPELRGLGRDFDHNWVAVRLPE